MKVVHHKNGDPHDNHPDNLEVRKETATPSITAKVDRQRLAAYERLQDINADLLAALEVVTDNYQDMRKAFYALSTDGSCPAIEKARAAIAVAKARKQGVRYE